MSNVASQPPVCWWFPPAGAFGTLETHAEDEELLAGVPSLGCVPCSLQENWQLPPLVSERPLVATEAVVRCSGSVPLLRCTDSLGPLLRWIDDAEPPLAWAILVLSHEEEAV